MKIFSQSYNLWLNQLSHDHASTGSMEVASIGATGFVPLSLLILECDAICASVEYRLEPEHSYSIAAEDCYTGLKWVSENTQEMNICS